MLSFNFLNNPFIKFLHPPLMNDQGENPMANMTFQFSISFHFIFVLQYRRVQTRKGYKAMIHLPSHPILSILITPKATKPHLSQPESLIDLMDVLPLQDSLSLCVLYYFLLFFLSLIHPFDISAFFVFIWLFILAPWVSVLSFDSKKYLKAESDYIYVYKYRSWPSWVCNLGLNGVSFLHFIYLSKHYLMFGFVSHFR
jgi:hypothetical protein